MWSIRGDDLADGSSPHSRGALHTTVRAETPTGIIPAFAGSTGRGERPRRRHTDHPRIRGEHRHRDRSAALGPGSSPHSRGAPGWPPRSRVALRIIPAFAGSTSSVLCACHDTADHPRIRGEHNPGTTHPARGVGSSPHSRGAPPPDGPGTAPVRIIPAFAGSTATDVWTRVQSQDHPRIRGEHDPDTEEVLVRSGSSPHSRGAPNCSHSSNYSPGIIPAFAGSTHPPRRWSGDSWDHPRIRGEHDAHEVRELAADGSSPHSRGALQAPIRLDQVRRIIPAFAGSTMRPARRAETGWDHPRIRGEHWITLPSSTYASGSSPHSRGAPRRGP